MKTVEFFGEHHYSDGLFDATVELFERAKITGVKKILLEARPVAQESIDVRIAERKEMFSDPDFSVEAGLASLRKKYLAATANDTRNKILFEAKIAMAAAYDIKLICSDASNDYLNAFHLVDDIAFISETTTVMAVIESTRRKLNKQAASLGLTEQHLTEGLDLIETAYATGDPQRVRELYFSLVSKAPANISSTDEPRPETSYWKAYYSVMREGYELSAPYCLYTDSRLKAVEVIRGNLAFYSIAKGTTGEHLSRGLAIIEEACLNDTYSAAYDVAFDNRMTNDSVVARLIDQHTEEDETVYVIYGLAHGDLNRAKSKAIPTALMDLGIRVKTHKIDPATGEIQLIFESLPRPVSVPRGDEKPTPDMLR